MRCGVVSTQPIRSPGPPPPSDPPPAGGGGGGDGAGRGPRWRLAVVLGVVVALLVVGVVVLLTSTSSPVAVRPRCTVTAPPNSPTLPSSYAGTPEQLDSAATIAGVGRRLGVPDRAVTIALATAVQESGLANLAGGDRDSVGLFQQRPSQGWGTVAQISDPVHAATAFYDALLQVPGWQTLDVTAAAQAVQRSGYPEAYADHEPEARLLAVAFLGQAPTALTCSDLDLAAPSADGVADLARTELGDARLSGPQATAPGWADATWLVAHAARLGLDRVGFDGRTWTTASGRWDTTGPADGRLTLHRAGDP